MKRIFSLVAVLAASLILAAEANAQFGMVFGLTSSSVKMAKSDAISLYHAGFTAKIPLGSGFALQPSLLYQVKGANVGQLGTASDEDFKVKTGFVELPLAIQWGPQLAAFRPFVFGEPFVGYRVSSTDKGNDTFRDWASQAKNKFEYGFGLGAGVDIADHIQLSAQWFNNLGTMFAGSSDASTESLGRVKNFEGIKFSLAILF
ncbi:MAG: PorT family protein [Bacteroidales bacterium]|nr:PorT family protein [Bacteroidales bacterium]